MAGEGFTTERAAREAIANVKNEAPAATVKISDKQPICGVWEEALTLDELASDVAIALIADPGNHFVRIWRQEDALGWDWGQESVPPLAEVVYAGRVDNSDVDLVTDLTDYDR